MLNLTLKPINSPEVKEPQRFKQEIKDLLTFHEVPTKKELEERAIGIAIMAVENSCSKVVIDCPTFFIPNLMQALNERYISVYFPIIVNDKFNGFIN